jgi:uncharacterized protein
MIMDRKTVIQAAVTAYFDALEKKDFDLIPFAENVSLRAPLAPGGVNQPLVGREAVRSGWWQPLPSLLGDVTCLGVYFDENLTGAIAEGVVEILLEPRVLLRVADRFTVDEDGRITEQENHFDPRDVTSPGWAQAQPVPGREIAEQFYESIAQGDVPAVLGLLDDGIVWTEAEGFPYAGVYTGPQAVLDGVFVRLNTEWDGFRALPDEIVDGGAVVVATGWYEGTYKETQKTMRARFAHVMHLRNGKIAQFEQIVDSARVSESLR